jgi:cell wall-associated NlpC family hydrolase
LSPDQTSLVTSSRQEYRDQTRSRCIYLARSYIGVPWKHKGRSRTGIDCIGVPYVVGKELGLHTYDDSLDYGRQAKNFDFMRAMAPFGYRVKDLKDIQDADILVMRIPIFPQHVGMAGRIGDKQTLIHASVNARKVVEEYLTDEVKRTIIAVFRYKELA